MLNNMFNKIKELEEKRNEKKFQDNKDILEKLNALTEYLGVEFEDDCKMVISPIHINAWGHEYRKGGEEYIVEKFTKVVKKVKKNA